MTTPFFIEKFNSKEDLAAIFEDDGDTGYLYLYDPGASEGECVKAALQVYISKEANLAEDDVEIVWSQDDSKVGIRIEGVIWGLFDLKNMKRYQRRYKPGSQPDIPADALDGLG